MKIATWNVNSIKARKDRVLAWLPKHDPDVLCLQELKTEDSAFPFEEVRALGYEAATFGQRTYNGVAILTKRPLEDVRKGFDDGVDDTHARVITAKHDGVRIINLYVPNGGELDSEKWAYKLKWLERLMTYLATHHTPSERLVLVGDLNIAPHDIDVARVDEFKDTVLCHPHVRAAFQSLLRWGMTDVFRKHRPEEGLYSWWDYRMLGFPKNNGLRIDHILATQSLLETSTSASIDRDERKGKQPSDHAPVIATFEL